MADNSASTSNVVNNNAAGGLPANEELQHFLKTYRGNAGMVQPVNQPDTTVKDAIQSVAKQLQVNTEKIAEFTKSVAQLSDRVSTSKPNQETADIVARRIREEWDAVKKDTGLVGGFIDQVTKGGYTKLLNTMELGALRNAGVVSESNLKPDTTSKTDEQIKEGEIREEERSTGISKKMYRVELAKISDNVMSDLEDLLNQELKKLCECICECQNGRPQRLPRVPIESPVSAPVKPPVTVGSPGIKEPHSVSVPAPIAIPVLVATNTEVKPKPVNEEVRTFKGPEHTENKPTEDIKTHGWWEDVGKPVLELAGITALASVVLPEILAATGVAELIASVMGVAETAETTAAAAEAATAAAKTATEVAADATTTIKTAVDASEFLIAPAEASEGLEATEAVSYLDKLNKVAPGLIQGVNVLPEAEVTAEELAAVDKVLSDVPTATVPETASLVGTGTTALGAGVAGVGGYAALAATPALKAAASVPESINGLPVLSDEQWRERGYSPNGPEGTYTKSTANVSAAGQNTPTFNVAAKPQTETSDFYQDFLNVTKEFHNDVKQLINNKTFEDKGSLSNIINKGGNKTYSNTYNIRTYAGDGIASLRKDTDMLLYKLSTMN
jgi:hypothetical protein